MLFHLLPFRAIPGHHDGHSGSAVLFGRTAHFGQDGDEQRIYLDGGQLVQSFLREGWVADLVITTIPVLIGQVRSLFGPLPHDVQLQLLGSRSPASGLVQSTYRVLR